jgi:predicted lipase
MYKKYTFYVQGFYFAWLRVKAQVYALINDIMLSHCTHCNHVVHTGHSLGAAISGFSAFEVKLDFGNVSVAMYNIGMPRIGNPTFASAFAQYVSFDDQGICKIKYLVIIYNHTLILWLYSYVLKLLYI